MISKTRATVIVGAVLVVLWIASVLIQPLQAAPDRAELPDCVRFFAADALGHWLGSPLAPHPTAPKQEVDKALDRAAYMAIELGLRICGPSGAHPGDLWVRVDCEQSELRAIRGTKRPDGSFSALPTCDAWQAWKATEEACQDALYAPVSGRWPSSFDVKPDCLQEGVPWWR